MLGRICRSNESTETLRNAAAQALQSSGPLQAPASCLRLAAVLIEKLP
jgi:hypothetical protein